MRVRPLLIHFYRDGKAYRVRPYKPRKHAKAFSLNLIFMVILAVPYTLSTSSDSPVAGVELTVVFPLSSLGGMFYCANGSNCNPVVVRIFCLQLVKRCGESSS